MTNTTSFEIIIIGGSYAGLSAAMALGRSLRHVLIIDSGKPCNRQTPHAHNFITHDGETPAHITQKAKEQVLSYSTIDFMDDTVVTAEKRGDNFFITTKSGREFTSKKLLFATGVFDIMPTIPGFAECWGISVLHCPYCHGYEVYNKNIGLLANGDWAFEHSKFISHWSNKVTVFTDGADVLNAEQLNILSDHNIQVIEKKVNSLKHDKGQLIAVLCDDGNAVIMEALFARADFKQPIDAPVQLGCEMIEQGFIKVDGFQKTTVDGVYAAGDNTSMLRSISNAVAAGGLAGAMINKELIEEEFIDASSVLMANAE